MRDLIHENEPNKMEWMETEKLVGVTIYSALHAPEEDRIGFCTFVLSLGKFLQGLGT